MPNLARFFINGVSSTPTAGLDASAGQLLTFTPEGASSLVQRSTYEVYSVSEPSSPLASKDAPTLTLVGATSGQKVDAATPSAAVTCTLPNFDGLCASWLVRRYVNGGIDASGRFNPDYVFERLVAVRAANGMRKVIATEGTQYSPRGWADAQNEEVDQLMAGYRALAHQSTNSGSGYETVASYQINEGYALRVTFEMVGLQGSEVGIYGKVATYYRRVGQSAQDGWKTTLGKNPDSGAAPVEIDSAWDADIVRSTNTLNFQVKQNGENPGTKWRGRFHIVETPLPL